MMLVFWTLGMLLMASPTQDLALETVVSAEKDETHVTARMRNKGKEPASLLLHDYYCVVVVRVFDSAGKEREPRDARAMRGKAAEPHEVKVSVIPPDGTVDVETFVVCPQRKSARGGPFSWDLKNFDGATLKVEFTYSLTPEHAERAATRGGAGAAVGSWTSPRLEVSTKTVPKPVWEIDGQETTRKKYDRFLGSLKEVEKTWFCAESKDGGITVYDVEDAAGTVHEVRTMSSLEGSRCSVRKKS